MLHLLSMTIKVVGITRGAHQHCRYGHWTFFRKPETRNCDWHVTNLFKFLRVFIMTENIGYLFEKLATKIRTLQSLSMLKAKFPGDKPAADIG